MPSRIAPTITVYLNGKAAPYIRAMTVQRSTGGRRLDHAVLRRDLGAERAYIQGVQLQAAVNGTVAIVGQLPSGQKKVYFVGKITRERILIEEHQEVDEYVAQLAPYLFGEPIYGLLDYDVNAKQVTAIDGPLLFNPEIDGRTYGNKRTGNTYKTRNGNLSLFVDTESLRSNPARQYQGEPPLPTAGTRDEANLWKLSEVVFYLCWNGNPNEQNINNPALADLQKVIDDADDLVRNFHLPQGLYLPAALDAVLEPLGYSWFVAINDKNFDLTIQVFKRGVGTAVTSVYLQDPGEQLSVSVGGEAISNAASTQIELDIGSLYNQIVGLGDYGEIESTFTLTPLWDASKDNLIATPYLLNREDSGFVPNGYHDVWRKWGLNEAGDYIGLRPELKGPYGFAELGLDPSATLAKRRRFHPMLTLGPDLRPYGHMDGCKIEYYDPNYSLNQGWRDVPGGCELLHTECAIYFGDRDIPAHILALAQGVATDEAGSGVQIRITASVRFDLRLQTVAVRQNTSPNGDLIQLVLDWSHLFHYRQVSNHSQFYVQVSNGTLKAVQDDGTDAMQKFCDQIRDVWDMASVNGPIVIEGVDDWRDPPAYDVGMSVDALEGRGVSFNAVAQGQAYPQIAGITYDFQHQRTTLQLERFRERLHFLREGAGEITDVGMIQ